MSQNPRFDSVKETIELLEWGFNIQEAIASALSDGKINMLDAPKFAKVAFGSITGIGGVHKIAKELADRDSLDLVLEYFKDRFDLPSEQLEDLIEDCMTNMMSLINLARRITKYRA